MNMPCFYTGSADGDAALLARQALDIRERMLCAVCRQIVEDMDDEFLEGLLVWAGTNADGLKDQQILDWWHKHKAADAAIQEGRG